MARTGYSIQNRARVLKSPIPQGGFGRPLTRAECQGLRDLGISCSTSWHVVRQVFELSGLGICYKPSGMRGMDHTGIYVE